MTASLMKESNIEGDQTKKGEGPEEHLVNKVQRKTKRLEWLCGRHLKRKTAEMLGGLKTNCIRKGSSNDHYREKQAREKMERTFS